MTIDGAKAVLFNITGGSDLKLSEVHEAAEVLQRVVDPDANIIFGMVTDLKMETEVKLTVVATDFPTPESSLESEEHVNEIAPGSARGRELRPGHSSVPAPRPRARRRQQQIEVPTA